MSLRVYCEGAPSFHYGLESEQMLEDGEWLISRLMVLGVNRLAKEAQTNYHVLQHLCTSKSTNENDVLITFTSILGVHCTS